MKYSKLRPADVKKLRPKKKAKKPKKVSPFAEHIEQILLLLPGEGIAFALPEGRDMVGFRRSIRRVITQFVQGHSPHRYRVEEVSHPEFGASIMVTCEP